MENQHKNNFSPFSCFACKLVDLEYTYEDPFEHDIRETRDYFWRCQRFTDKKAADAWLSNAKFATRPELGSKLFDIKFWPTFSDRTKFEGEAGLRKYKVLFDEDDEPDGTWSV